MSVSRWLGIVGGVLLCVSAFTPLRDGIGTGQMFFANRDPFVVDGGAWMLVAAGVLAIIASIAGHQPILIGASVVAAAAASFVAGSLRGAYINVLAYGNSNVVSENAKYIVPAWGWLLVVGGVVLVTAAAILAKIPHNSKTA